MKYYLLFVIFCFSGVSCSKENNLSIPFIKTWKLHSTMISPGGLLIDWIAVDPAEAYQVSFSRNGNVVWEPSDAGKAKKFKVLDESTVLFKRDARDYKMTYNISGDTLILSGRSCTEGCSWRYVAVSNE